MDCEGVDQAVLFSSIGLYFCWVDEMDPELSAAMCRAYNNWLYDYCAIDHDRLKGVCLLPLQDPALAKQELQRAIQELGMVGIFWRPNPLNGREVTHPDYDEIYALCEQAGVAVCYHEGQSTVLAQFAKGRVDTRFARHSCSHPMEQMGAVVRTTSDGLFDRFPNLHIAFLESGSGWLPYCLEHLDNLWQTPQFRESYKGVHKPSEYFRRGQASISCEASERTIPLLGRTVSEDCLMWASDYPHPDCIEYFPDTFGGIISNEEISQEFKRKILSDNPARVFNLQRSGDVAKTASAQSGLSKRQG
jgi:predicted TIM-barrel fold metal-dependent hydrolase